MHFFANVNPKITYELIKKETLQLELEIIMKQRIKPRATQEIESAFQLPAKSDVDKFCKHVDSELQSFIQQSKQTFTYQQYVTY